MSVMQPVAVWGECGDFGFSARTWQLVLTLGRWYGWQPAGTLPPDPEYFDDWDGEPADWDGHYFPPDGQIMTANDAQGLADALERAYADLPDHDALTGKAIPRRPVRDDDPCRWWGLDAAAGMAVSPFEEFGGVNKAWLRDVIVHCRSCAELWLC